MPMIVIKNKVNKGLATSMPFVISIYGKFVGLI